MNFAVLNVETAMFCQTAITSANDDQEIAVMQQLAMAQEHAEAMRNLFDATDVDRSGEITFDELDAQLENEDVKALFESLGLRAHDAWALFCLLDSNKHGSIKCNEFVEACTTARGNAKAIHIANVRSEQKHIKTIMRDMRDEILEHLVAVESELQRKVAKVIPDEDGFVERRV
eukprot:TRINITY_DN76305_c0_g1_i1.p1 TRINITY_DN76305_c0_g1~~TRINITY_DN76305_c0_g1_i1.p1  ORF type:complete len:174 (+),score=42.64 TRINITY_DN76305_c0_g1_i1:1-522(+)